MRTNETKFSLNQTGPHRGATLFVWGAWFVLSAALIFATVMFVRSFPWLDDFAFLYFAIDKAPLTLEWLWHPHNEHRILLPKLFCWSTLKLDGGNFILAKYLYSIALSFCAALLLLSLRKARGYLLWTDAAIPVVLLGFHNLFNILWFFQAPFILATILTYLLLAMMVRNWYRLKRAECFFGRKLCDFSCVMWCEWACRRHSSHYLAAFLSGVLFSP